MPEPVKTEIDEMLRALGENIPASSNEDKDEEEEEEKEEPVKEEVKEDEQKEDKETKDSEDKGADREEEQEEVEDKDKIIESLRRQIEEGRETKVEKKEEPVKEEPLTLESQDFIGDLDLEDALRDKDTFNKLLNTVYTKGVEDARRLTSERVLLSIPDIVKNNLNIITTLKKDSDDFYDANKDLVPFKKVVAVVFEELAAKNPDKKYSEIMKEVAPEARKRLELHQKTVKEEKEKFPKLPGKKGTIRSTDTKPNTSPIQDELNAMNTSLGR